MQLLGAAPNQTEPTALLAIDIGNSNIVIGCLLYTSNYVPAAAVIRRGQALSGITGRKGRLGGKASLA